jgi:hypothetical protein
VPAAALEIIRTAYIFLRASTVRNGDTIPINKVKSKIFSNWSCILQMFSFGHSDPETSWRFDQLSEECSVDLHQEGVFYLDLGKIGRLL